MWESTKAVHSGWHSPLWPSWPALWQLRAPSPLLSLFPVSKIRCSTSQQNYSWWNPGTAPWGTSAQMCPESDNDRFRGVLIFVVSKRGRSVGGRTALNCCPLNGPFSKWRAPSPLVLPLGLWCEENLSRVRVILYFRWYKYQVIQD